MAEWVKGGGALPHLPDLVAELTTPTYSFQGDRMQIEPKEQIKKRLGRSPDLADALALTFAWPVVPGPRTMEGFGPPADFLQRLAHATENSYAPGQGDVYNPL
jgi:hypothetical protein